MLIEYIIEEYVKHKFVFGVVEGIKEGEVAGRVVIHTSRSGESRWTFLSFQAKLQVNKIVVAYR